ncbi:S-layer homology domain-containing protein [Evansella sp. AB-rgal1]|uniref:S-layer homology domain-containing protein n=1 Tax=Evansella sp. AB-rgal1 TaxID=3242696 RepID=UPI00359E86B5
MKKWGGMFIIILLFGMTMLQSYAFASDIQGHPQQKEMKYLNDNDIMLGNGKGNFNPNGTVTRAQFAAFVARALELPEGENNFPDVPVGYQGNLDTEIGRAASANIIEGFGDGTFRPSEPVTREQMAVIIHKALKYEGIETGSLMNLTFHDTNTISNWAKEAIQVNVSLGIINGNTDNTFKPQHNAIRAHAAKVIFEMLNVIEPIIIENPPVIEKPEPPVVATPYQVVTINSSGTRSVVNSYATYDQAVANVKSNQFIVLDSKIIHMDKSDGGTVTALARPYTLLYSNESLRSNITYIETGSQMEFLEVKGNAVKVRISGAEGYAKLSDVRLNPSVTNPVRSHYRVNANGQLLHYTYVNAWTPGPYSVGPAASFMNSQTTYYSWNGFGFGNQNVYQYFQYLPFYTQSKYTAEELNSYVRAVRPTSPLKDLGQAFKKVEAETGVNALHLLALAIHEGGWGESAIARDKKNLFGVGAYDSGAYENARTYATYEDSIRDAARLLKNTYSNHNSSIYHGPQLGNKGVGANVRYASDPFWGQKAAGHMHRIDDFLGGKDTRPENRYKIGLKNIDSVINVRSVPTTSGNSPLYQLKQGNVGQAMLIVDEQKDQNGDTWYRVVSDHPNYNHVWVYGNGSLGEYVRILPTFERLFIK